MRSVTAGPEMGYDKLYSIRVAEESGYQMAEERTPRSGENTLNGQRNGYSIKKGRLPRRRKLKLISVLLTALLPGLGHLYLRLFAKGIVLIYLILIDVAALIYFSSVRMQINVPLLILLALLVPVVYFYSIYNVLQSTDNLNARRAAVLKEADPPGRSGELKQGLGIGALLIGGGLILFVLRQKPDWLAFWLQRYAAYGVAAVFLAAGALLPVWELRRRFKRTGRFTASVFLLSLGITLVLDQSLNQDNMLLYLKWWPVLFVLLGIETVIWFILRGRLRARASSVGLERKFRIDIRGLLLTLLSAVCVFAVTQQDHYLQLWKKVSLNLAAASADFSEASGYSVLKEPLFVPADSASDKLTVDGINGDIIVTRGEGYDLEVRSRVFVDEADMAAAAKIAEDTSVEVGSDSGFSISVKDESYGSSGKRHPKVNLFITLPSNHTYDLDVVTTNGNLLVKNIAAGKISLQTGNGKMELRNVFGKISAKTLNGDVLISEVNGDIDADTKSGSFNVKNTYGDLNLTTLVGDLEVANSFGKTGVSTKNGNIAVHEAVKALSAETQNGLISIDSSLVGGDWNVYSAVGEIDCTLPETADYKLEGSSGYGGIETNLPFPVENKTIKGEKGTGEYQINLDGNSNIVINEKTAPDKLPGMAPNLAPNMVPGAVPGVVPGIDTGPVRE